MVHCMAYTTCTAATVRTHSNNSIGIGKQYGGNGNSNDRHLMLLTPKRHHRGVQQQQQQQQQQLQGQSSISNHSIGRRSNSTSKLQNNSRVPTSYRSIYANNQQSSSTCTSNSIGVVENKSTLALFSPKRIIQRFRVDYKNNNNESISSSVNGSYGNNEVNDDDNTMMNNNKNNIKNRYQFSPKKQSKQQQRQQQYLKQQQEQPVTDNDYVVNETNNYMFSPTPKKVCKKIHNPAA